MPFVANSKKKKDIIRAERSQSENIGDRGQHHKFSILFGHNIASNFKKGILVLSSNHHRRITNIISIQLILPKHYLYILSFSRKLEDFADIKQVLILNKGD